MYESYKIEKRSYWQQELFIECNKCHKTKGCLDYVTKRTALAYQCSECRRTPEDNIRIRREKRLADPEYRLKHKAYTDAWRKTERGRAYMKAMKKTPKGKLLSKQNKYLRELRLRECTPKWLTKEHRKQIRDLIAQRDLLREQGQEFHLDHIIPIRGENVCGLNVPWNLQLLPAEENIKKSNKLVI